jgi:hypothetical protein
MLLGSTSDSNNKASLPHFTINKIEIIQSNYDQVFWAFSGLTIALLWATVLYNIVLYFKPDNDYSTTIAFVYVVGILLVFQILVILFIRVCIKDVTVISIILWICYQFLLLAVASLLTSIVNDFADQGSIYHLWLTIVIASVFTIIILFSYLIVRHFIHVNIAYQHTVQNLIPPHENEHFDSSLHLVKQHVNRFYDKSKIQTCCGIPITNKDSILYRIAHSSSLEDDSLIV